MRRPIAETDARRLLSGGPVTLVTSSWHGKQNVMPAAFVTALSFDPPLVGVAISPTRHSYDMIRYSEQFALNIPSRRLLHHVQYLGSVSGADVDKLELTRLPTFKATRVEAPLIEGCVGYVECGVEDALRTGDHVLFVGQVLAASADAEAFDGTWLVEDDDEKPLHYLGVNRYALLGPKMEARIPQPEEGREKSPEEAFEEQMEAAREEEEKRREGGEKRPPEERESS
ncbi:MAG TPA: flavin reductase family protein [Dehalococcoidia bacterium]|nr:flavin reductase family protein [Dehalococcoidia bacterium]